jgi:tripartite-type tricarboxylate transporter receptor subunit TctC
MKRMLEFAAIAAALTLAPLAAHAQAYPSETIHIIVPWEAGGGTDRIARGFAEALENAAGVSVVVENVGGAGSITGTVKAARSEPDGYTLLLNMDSAITGAMAFREVPFALDDFAYVGGVYASPTWVVSHADAGLETLADFIERARAEPGELTLGTAGPVGSPMLMAAAIKGFSGADFRIIPYQGGADLRKALLGNQVSAGVIHAPVMLAEVEEGMIRVLAAGEPLDQIVYEPIRDTPVLSDFGIDASFGLTRAIFAPKDTPPEVLARLTELVRTAVQSEGYAAFGREFGFAPTWIEGEDFRAGMEEQLSSFTSIRERFVEN